MERCPPPWILKPRSEASAIGLKKLYQPDDLWRALDELGDRQSFFLLEAFVPGDVYHVDALVAEGAVTFAEAHGYVSPPFEVMHDGGIFATRTLARDGEEAAACRAFNRDLVQGFGMLRGAVHTEFIRSRDDGQFYFLETAARVGGANIPAMVEAATGVNLWRGWAQIELADVRGAAPAPLDPRADYAGLVISLAKQAWPDLAAYDDLEADGAASIAWRMRKKYHAGLALRAPDPATVEARLHAVMQRFRDDFHASLPAPATTDEL
jgi:biotin carboxylase